MPSSKIHKLIQNPFYYGVMRIKGQILPAKHEPIISKELFDRCQEIRLGWKKKPFKYSDKPFIFRGLIKCAHCGCTITSDLKKGKYIYLHCTKSKGACEGKRLREEPILEQVKDIFKDLRIPDDVLAAIKNHLNQSVQVKREYYQEAINRIHSEYNLTQKKLERLLDMRLEESITQSEYDKKCVQLRGRQDELGEDLRRHTEADEKFNTTLLTLFDLASRAYDLFESSKVDQKRQPINLTLSNLALNGRTLEYQKRKPFSDFPKTASCAKMLRDLDSNQDDQLQRLASYHWMIPDRVPL